MKKRIPLLILSLIGCLPVEAKYLSPELKDIPLNRLITNLSERAKADPANSEVLHQLARTHAMAYAGKLDDSAAVETRSGRGDAKIDQPWFGFQPPHVPFHEVTKTEEAKKLAAAKAHLATAIETYRKALAAKPADPALVKLGLAWCQDQAGDKNAAVALYREVAAAAWEKESKSGGGLGNFLYVETVGYLIPLLDPKKDAAEISTCEERKKTLLALPRAVTPLVIPMGKSDDPASLVNPSAGVRFDLDGTGRRLPWPWLNLEAAWLVFDPKKTGNITSSTQMLGSRSFLLFCSDGYQALALLDDNRDGVINGSELTGLSLWRDANSDGISDPGEVLPVASHGIVSLSARGQPHESGIPYSPKGVTFEDGTVRPTYDLILKPLSTEEKPR